MVYDSNLRQPSLYDFDSRPENITLRRRDLENHIRMLLERIIVEGGGITNLSRDCMQALDALAGNVESH